MKKGIDVYPDRDGAGNWFLRVTKKRGKLTIDEIREAVTQYEEDYYGLILKCIDEDVGQSYEDDLPGDEAMLYPVQEFLKDGGHVKEVE